MLFFWQVWQVQQRSVIGLAETMKGISCFYRL